MTRRSIARLALRLLAVALALASSLSAFASGEPQESFTYQNFIRAHEVLDRAIAAHGGTALIDRAVNIRLPVAGTNRWEGHYPRPWAHRDYKMNGVWLYSADLRAVKSDVTYTYETEDTNPSFTLMGPVNGVMLEAGNTRPDTVPQEKLEDQMRKEFEIFPHEYLRQARDASASLRLLSGSDDYDVLHYNLDNGEAHTLFFDASTHLLMRVEHIAHWTIKGDRLEWRTFADYVDRNGIMLPVHSEVHIEGFSTQENVISDITGIEIGAAVSADEFTIPAAYREGYETWVLKTPKRDDPNELLPFDDLGKGVYVIGLPPSDSRALLVAFSDFSVVVEAGDRSELSARILATADHLLPKKPVRYVAMSHHHPLYANGLRPYAQRGITILTTKGNVSYLRDLTTRPYRIQPDAQQRRPREPKFEVIDGSRTIKSGKQRLEFYEFDYSTHVDEFVLTYLPSHKLIVTGDLFYALRDAELRPAGPRTRALHRLVNERKLDVESIMQTWFLTRSDHLTPYSVLEESIRRADEAEAKK